MVTPLKRCFVIKSIFYGRAHPLNAGSNEGGYLKYGLRIV